MSADRAGRVRGGVPVVPGQPDQRGVAYRAGADHGARRRFPAAVHARPDDRADQLGQREPVPADRPTSIPPRRNAWQGVNSAGVNAAWLDEATVNTDATPALGQIQIFPKKAAAWILGALRGHRRHELRRPAPRRCSPTRRTGSRSRRSRWHRRFAERGAAGGVLWTIARPAPGSGCCPPPAGAGLPDARPVRSPAAGRWTSTTCRARCRRGSVTPRSRRGSRTCLNINRIRALDQYGGSSFWANLGDGHPGAAARPADLRVHVDHTVGDVCHGYGGNGVDSAVPPRVRRLLPVQHRRPDRHRVLFERLVHGSGTGTAAYPSGQSGWFMFWRVGSDVTTPAAFRWLTNGSG